MKDVFAIKLGSGANIRLFFYILGHPWETLRLVNDFRKELGKLEAEIVSLKMQLAEALEQKAKLMMEISHPGGLG